ncbi:MAG: molybdopterin-dependent oxidoreductase [Syntrophaceae bacterium]|nr:molybdopterin-dependent oxidoreductase [Syntrophaceae bacterium]
MVEKTIKKGLCGICPSGCGVEISMKGERLHRIKPMEGHPLGIVCRRGIHAEEIIYSPDRLPSPMKRIGNRGEGKFEKISWEEAFERSANLIKKVIEKSGPEAMAIYSGRGGFEESLIDIFTVGGHDHICLNFLFPLGSPNTFSCSSLCNNAHRVIAPVSTFGVSYDRLFPDFEKSDQIVVWGSNPATDSPPIHLKKILEAKARGTKVVVIDPLKTYTAEKSGEWIGLRPGTDGALALGMAHVMMEKGFYDEAFANDWIHGLEEFKDYVKGFPPEVVEKITWVKAEKIRKLAEDIAKPKTSLLLHTGLEYTNSGVQNIRAILIFWALAGNLDRPGGLVFRMSHRSPARRNRIEPPRGKPAIGSDRHRLYCVLNRSGHFMEVPRAILKGEPYPVRGLIVLGGSIITAFPNPEEWRRSIEALDCLLVIDRFLTNEALYADIVFPATTMFEITSYKRYPGHLSFRERVVPPVGEARNDYLILAGLAKALGYGDHYPQSEEAMLEFVFQESPEFLEKMKSTSEGLSLPSPPMFYEKYKTGLLRKDGHPGFETPSKKFEIASNLLKKYGHDPLPIYQEPSEGPIGSPDLVKEFPLVLTTGTRLQSAFRSQHLNIPGLLKLQDKPNILIHPEDADPRGIQNGDKVWVKTKRGKVPFYAKVTRRIMKGVIEANMGGGGPLQPQSWREANVNELTDSENRDSISGFPVFKALLCEVEKG